MKQNNQLLPAFDFNNIPVVFSCDENFIPYLGVCIKSIIECSSIDNNYDIIIFKDKIPNWKEDRIKKLSSELKNFSIRFVDIYDKLEKYKEKFYIRGRYSYLTYARFFIPEILQSFDKVIYLDADVIVLDDLSKLYNIDLSGYMLGAALDYAVICNYYNGKYGNQKCKYAYDYITKYSDFMDIKQYFQAGVLLFNINQCVINDFFKKALYFLSFLEKPLLVDQDILNLIAKDKVFIFSGGWNFQWHLQLDDNINLLKKMPYKYYNELIDNSNNFFIIHFCSNSRPWFNPFGKNAELFWNIARRTVFYEEILYSNLNKTISSSVLKESYRPNYSDLILFRKNIFWFYYKILVYTMKSYFLTGKSDYYKNKKQKLLNFLIKFK